MPIRYVTSDGDGRLTCLLPLLSLGVGAVELLLLVLVQGCGFLVCHSVLQVKRGADSRLPLFSRVTALVPRDSSRCRHFDLDWTSLNLSALGTIVRVASSLSLLLSHLHSHVHRQGQSILTAHRSEYRTPGLSGWPFSQPGTCLLTRSSFRCHRHPRISPRSAPNATQSSENGRPCSAARSRFRGHRRRRRLLRGESGQPAAILCTQLWRTHRPLLSLQTVKLEQYKGKWVVLFFYPLDCTLPRFPCRRLGFSPSPPP